MFRKTIGFIAIQLEESAILKFGFIAIQLEESAILKFP
jgi:hypothetical protein